MLYSVLAQLINSMCLHWQEEPGVLCQRVGQSIKTSKALGETADSVPAERAAVCQDVILPAITSNNSEYKLRRWNGKWWRKSNWTTLRQSFTNCLTVWHTHVPVGLNPALSIPFWRLLLLWCGFGWGKAIRLGSWACLKIDIEKIPPAGCW